MCDKHNIMCKFIVRFRYHFGVLFVEQNADISRYTYIIILCLHRHARAMNSYDIYYIGALVEQEKFVYREETSCSRLTKSVKSGIYNYSYIQYQILGAATTCRRGIIQYNTRIYKGIRVWCTLLPIICIGVRYCKARGKLVRQSFERYGPENCIYVQVRFIMMSAQNSDDDLLQVYEAAAAIYLQIRTRAEDDPSRGSIISYTEYYCYLYYVQSARLQS